jgi:hypothetical protein
MKQVIIFMLFGFTSHAQLSTVPPDSIAGGHVSTAALVLPSATGQKSLKAAKWRITPNHWLTGGLVFIAGGSKGFNETLQAHWKGFRHIFPHANQQWFNPDKSWRNKYKNGDPDAGAKFLLSTSVLVMFTDQYHLNNFITKAAWTSALIIKIGEGKKPFNHYVFDFLFYSLCHQLGFGIAYYPFKAYRYP